MVKTLFAIALAAAVMMALPVRYHETMHFDSGPMACEDGTTLDSAMYVVDSAKAGVVDIERVTLGISDKTVSNATGMWRANDPVMLGSRAYYFRYKQKRKMLAALAPGKSNANLRDYSVIDLRSLDRRPEPLSGQS